MTMRRLRGLVLFLALAACLTACEDEVVELQLAPDGERLLVAARNHGKGQLLLLSREGGRAKELFSESVVVDDGLAWLPDSRRFVCCRRVDGNEDLWLIDSTSGTLPTRLTEHAARDFAPRVSPDGKTVIFISTREGDWDIHRLNLADGAVAPLERRPHDQTLPRLSPDAEWLFYLSYENLRPEAYCLNLATRERDLIEEALDAESRPPRLAAWAPDASALVFSRDTEGGTELLAYDPKAQRAKRVTRFGKRLEFLTPIPGGRRLAAVEEGGRAVQLSLSGWGRRTRALAPGGLAVSRLSFSGDGRRLAFSAGSLLGLSTDGFKSIERRLIADSEPREVAAQRGAWLREHLRQDQAKVARGLYQEWLPRFDDANDRAALTLAYARGLIDSESDAEAYPLCRELVDDDSLTSKVRAEAVEFVGQIEFDYLRRFDIAWRAYQKAWTLRWASGDPDKMPVRHLILQTDNMKLIEAYARYFAEPPDSRKAFARLRAVLEIDPSSAPALERLVAAARTPEERRMAAERLLGSGATDRLMVLGELFKLKDRVAVQQYFARYFDELIVREEVGGEFKNAVDVVAYPCRFAGPPKELEETIRFFDSPEMQARIRPLFDTPELLMKRALLLLRLTLTRERPEKLTDVLLYAHDVRQTLGAVSTGTAQLHAFFWIYTGLVSEELRQFKKAGQGYMRARQLLPDAHAALTSGTANEASGAPKIDWRELTLWLDCRASLMLSAKSPNAIFLAYHELERPLRLGRLGRRLTREETRAVLKAAFDLLRRTSDPNLRALCMQAAGRCFEQLERPRLAAAYYRAAVDLQPLKPLRALCLLRLAALAKSDDDPFLERRALRQLDELIDRGDAWRRAAVADQE